MPLFAVIGLGRFGGGLAVELSNAGAEVIGIDRQPRMVEAVKDQVTLAVRMDSTDRDALQAHGVDHVDAAIVGIGNDFESTALTVALLTELGVKNIVARAESDMQAQILKRVGASSIIYPERESALRWAHRLMLPKLEQYVELGEGQSMISIETPVSFQNKSLKELQLRRRFGVNLVAIRRRPPLEPGETEAPPARMVIPEPDTTIIPTDVLVLLGDNEALSRIPTE